MAILPEERKATRRRAQQNAAAVNAIQVFFNLNTGNLANRRRQIERAHDAGVILRASFDLARPDRNERHANATFIDGPFPAAIDTCKPRGLFAIEIFFGAIRWTIVTGENDQRPFTQSQMFDFINDAPDLVVHIFKHCQKSPVVRIV